SAGAPVMSLSRMAPTAPKVPAMSQPVSALNWGASAPTSPCAAPPLNTSSCIGPGRSRHGGNDALARDGQIAHAHPERRKHRIADGGGRGAVRGFARAECPLLRARYDLDLDGRHVREAQDRVGLPA